MDNTATKTGQMLTLEAKKMQSSTVCRAVECLSSFQIPFLFNPGASVLFDLNET